MKKQLLFLVLGALSILALGQTPPAPHQSRWRTFAINQDETVHQVDLASITKPNAKGIFRFVNRSIFKHPILISDSSSKSPVIGAMMQAEGSCITRHTAIVHDFMVTVDQHRVEVDSIAKQDSMSAPDDGSIHSAILDLVCGKKVSV